MISNAAFENSLDIGEESTVSKREVSGFEGFCCWLGGNMTTLFQGSWLEALSQLPVKWCYQYSCALPSHCFRYYFVWHAVKTKFSSSGSNLCTWHLSQSHFCLGMQKCEMWVKRASLLQWSSFIVYFPAEFFLELPLCFQSFFFGQSARSFILGVVISLQ